MQAIESKELHPSEQLQAGDTLGRYQLLCPIARGGMGQVWAARQTGRLGLPKLVAIKTAIPMESKDYDQVQEYLFDEAQVAASVDHPNVCKILELGQERDVLFIAMEWLNGVPLSTLVSRLPQRRLTYRMAAYLVAQACSGLHAAHELTDDDGVHMEVVHRDATPHNFMITSTGELKVMDFGIVKSKNQQHQATQNGELKGKISYVAPEQIRGRSVDRRADIFTLGCVLYFISVGKGAFNPDADQDAGQTILRILSGDFSPPTSVLPDYPAELEAIVTRALATAPERRFQTAEEMRLALEAFLGDGTRPITREDVADLLQKYCGAGIEHRRTEIRSAQRMFDSQSGQMRSGAYPTAERAYPTGTLELRPPSSAEIALAPSGNTQRSAGAFESTPRPSHKRLWGAVGAAALLFGAGAFAMSSLRQADADSDGHATSPKAADAAPATPSTAEPQLHQGLRTSPAAATPPSPEGATLASPAKAEGSSKATRKGIAARAMPRAVVPTVAPSVAAADPAPAPPAPNNQFSQPLTRKPPRLAIDERDPFGK